MKTIIAGSRSIVEPFKMVGEAIVASGFTITEVISGTCYGPDRAGEAWAIANKVPVKQFPANWDKYGKGAGYRRNEDMANNADALIAIWDGLSKGTKHMIDIAERKGLRVYVYKVNAYASTPEKDRLVDRLCNDPSKKFINFNVFRGDAPCTQEELCFEINRAIDSIENGDCEEVKF